MSREAHSRDLGLHRLSDVPATFFVTKSLQPKKPVLTAELRAMISQAFVFAAEKERIHLRTFVVMPDHWHALFALPEPWTLSKFMHAHISHIGAKTNDVVAAAKIRWQDGFYETLVKTAKQFHFVSEYPGESSEERIRQYARRVGCEQSQNARSCRGALAVLVRPQIAPPSTGTKAPPTSRSGAATRRVARLTVGELDRLGFFQNMPRDDEALHFARAFTDRAELGVTQITFDR